MDSLEVEHVGRDAADAHEGLDGEAEDPGEVPGHLSRVRGEAAAELPGRGAVEEGGLLGEQPPEQPQPQVLIGCTNDWFGRLFVRMSV